jgi:CheY-like chemotaxis protein
MSHEIRTPLNGVLGMAQAMAGDELSDRQRDRLSVIHRSGEALLAILNDVLDLSKIEAGKLELKSVPFDPHVLVETTVRIMAANATEKGLEMTCHVDSGVPRRVIGDPLRVRQVLSNLIGNAVKFTAQGRVSVGLSVAGAGPNPVLHFEVADTGIGIPQDKHAFIFEPFSQLDGSHTRRFGGTGLGLAICARFVGMMEGRIWVESEPGKGSRFHFTAKLSTAAQPPEPVALLAGPAPQLAVRTAGSEPAPTESRRASPALSILLAEDNLVNQKVAVRLLEKRGHRVVIAGNGIEALAALDRERFDLFLTDIQMPEMDGLEATAAIRARERQTGARIPIIALTAHAMRGDRERYLEAGMDDYVGKPIRAQELFAAVEGCCASLPGGRAS